MLSSLIWVCDVTVAHKSKQLTDLDILALDGPNQSDKVVFPVSLGVTSDV